MIKCPYCSEAIQPEAKKCKHCGEWLVEASGRPGTAGHESGSVDARAVARGIKKEKQDEAALGCLLTVWLFVTVFLGVWIGDAFGFWMGTGVGVTSFVGGTIWLSVKYNKE